MPATAARLATFARLRGELEARRPAGIARSEPVLPTGIAGVDEPLGGGLPRGALSELVFAAPSSGGQLVLLHLLHAARRTHRFLALVDGADGFDPPSIEPTALLRHLLWVRCAGPAQALQAADLLARDANFHLLALDLRGCATRELGRTPATAWYRLQRVIEPTDTVLAVLTPHRLVPAAAARLCFTRSLPLPALMMEQSDLAEQLTPGLERRRTRGDATTWTNIPSPPTPSLSRNRSLSPLRPVPRDENDYENGQENEPQHEPEFFVAEDDAAVVAAAG